MGLIRHFSILGAIALVLIVIEVPLELRAYSRGFQTFLFGWRGITPSTPVEGKEARSFGPSPSFPFWSEVVPEKLEAGETRYWITSASHAAETQLPLDLIFPVVLSDLCRERGQPCQVLSASAPGFTIPASAEQIETLASKYPPKVVIVYQMANDVIELARLVFSGASLETPPSKAEPGEKQALVSPRVLTHEFVDNMTAHQLLRTNLSNRVVAQRILHDELPEAARKVFITRLSHFIAVARKHGTEPVLCTFATSHRSDQIEQFPEAHRLKLFAFSRELSMPGWARTADLLNAEIRVLAQTEDLRLIDVAEQISGRHELFRDFYHFTPEGHREVAMVLANALLGAP